MAKPKKGKARTPPSTAYSEWSEAKFWGFIRSALRSASSRWPPKYLVLNAAKRPYVGPNKAQKWEAQCAECKGWFKLKDVAVDHIIPAGALSCWDDLVPFVERLFVSEDGLRVLCTSCHAAVTAKQRKGSPRISHPREEGTYRNMLSRCHNPRATGYENYGGRGITVCTRWRESFWNFYEDMGERPEGTTLDRIDTNGNYEPANCRWATWETQSNNRSDNIWLDFDDLSLTITQWARKLGTLPNTIQYRLYRGWSIGEALGYEKRVIPSKKRLQGELLAYVKEQFALGRTQTDIGREIGIDSSVVSRALKKTQEERKSKS